VSSVVLILLSRMCCLSSSWNEKANTSVMLWIIVKLSTHSNHNFLSEATGDRFFAREVYEGVASATTLTLPTRSPFIPTTWNFSSRMGVGPLLYLQPSLTLDTSHAPSYRRSPLGAPLYAILIPMIILKFLIAELFYRKLLLLLYGLTLPLQTRINLDSSDGASNIMRNDRRESLGR